MTRSTRPLLAAACAAVILAGAALAWAGDPPPPPLGKPVFALGPYVRYDAPRSATIVWQTAEKSPSVVVINGPGVASRRVRDAAPKTSHAVTISGLRPKAAYTYQVIKVVGGKDVPGRLLTLDMRFNFVRAPMGEKVQPFGDNSRYAKAADAILKASGVTQGYCLVYGFGKGRLALELARRSDLTIVGVSTDAAAVAEARQKLSDAGVYGTRITVHEVKSLDACGLTRFFANLIVSETMMDGAPAGKATEMFRMLRPAGGVACLPSSAGSWLAAGKVAAQSGPDWHMVRRGMLPGSGSWTHQYGTPGNRAFGGETLSGAASTREMEVQWVGRPGANFGLDRNPRMPAPLSAAGRLFHQGMRKMVALDAYNGTVLWLLEVPDLMRLNIPRDTSNWCIDAENVYVAVRDRCWVVSQTDGRLMRTLMLPDGYDAAKYSWGYTANVGGLVLGSCVRREALYSDFWTGASWYDAFSGPRAAKVCSDSVFAVDKAGAKTAWTYKKGAIINATLSADDQRVYFIESRNPAVISGTNRRIHDGTLWQNLFRVALDIKTGKVAWEHPVEAGTLPGEAVYHMAVADGRVVLVSSQGRKQGRKVRGQYGIYTYDAATGKPGWKAAHGWKAGHHGGHMQHPVITDRALYLEPCGYDIKTGQQISSRVGPRQGCATFAGTTNALLHRGPGRQSSMWSQTSQQSSQWTSLRPSCWLSLIPAGGMVLAPEGGGGCSCGGWIETSLGFVPVKTRSQAAPK